MRLVIAVPPCLMWRTRSDSKVRGRPPRSIATFTAALVFAGAVFAQAPAPTETPPRPTVPIKELMETTITEASGALWNAFDPPTADEQWAALEQAALRLIEAAKTNAVGGTGPMDNEWARQPAWKPFNDTMLRASEAALTAIRAKNHTALLEAGDLLYGPCEGCHAQFNPGVVNQN